MIKTNDDILIILGPTASGKTKLAANVAYRVNGEIISADSRQVYRGMDIGTGKDYEDYVVDNTSIPCHLIDIVDAGYKYNVYEYQNDFIKVLEDIRSGNKFPILCGGTGLYIEAVTKGYRLISVPLNPELRNELEKLSMNDLTEMLKSYKTLHNTTEITQRKRLTRAIEIEKFYSDNGLKNFDYPEMNCIYAGIDVEVSRRRERISDRLRERLENGMIEEVKNLIDSGVTKEDLVYYGLEYKYLAQYITGDIDFDTMFKNLEVAIHQFAKRQMTWFRGMERRGIKITWIPESLPLEEKIEEIIKLIKQVPVSSMVNGKQ